MVATEQVRYAFKFTGRKGTATFPLNGYQYEPSQGYRVSELKIEAVDYAWDEMGENPLAKDVGIEPVRFMIVGGTPTSRSDLYDSLLYTCRESGRGALWTTDASGDERYAVVKLVDRPGYASATDRWGILYCTFRFRRYSDWQQANAGWTVTVAPGQSPKTVVWHNPGTARIRLKITAAALAAAGYSSGFTIQNITPDTMPLGQMTTLRPSASTDSRVEFDGPRERVRYSTNAGGTWLDDYASVWLPAVQPDFAIDMAPGDNSLVFTVPGTSNVRFDAVGDSAYH